MVENYMVCGCMQVTYNDIADAMDNLKSLDDVLTVFKKSTGCNTLFYRLWWLSPESFGYHFSNYEWGSGVIEHIIGLSI